MLHLFGLSFFLFQVCFTPVRPYLYSTCPTVLTPGKIQSVYGPFAVQISFVCITLHFSFRIKFRELEHRIGSPNKLFGVLLQFVKIIVSWEIDATQP